MLSRFGCFCSDLWRFLPQNLAAPAAPPFFFMGMEQSLVSQSAPELGYEHTGEP
jgi:hypothetical protein